MHPLALVGIITVSLLVLGGAAAGAVSLVTTLTAAAEEPIDMGFLPGAEGDPLVTGDEASPLADEPMDCGGCFSDPYLQSMVIDRSELLALKLTETDYAWDPTPYAYESEATYYANSWHDSAGAPDSCYATFPSAPVAREPEGRVERDGSSIYYLGDYSDEEAWSTLSQSARLFTSDEEAVEFMTTVQSLVGGCSHYASSVSGTSWEADVTPAPALSVPSSVAAVGWVEVAPFSRFYAFDVQRGNLVVRTTLTTADEISELEFRSLVEHVALQLESLTP